MSNDGGSFMPVTNKRRRLEQLPTSDAENVDQMHRQVDFQGQYQSLPISFNTLSNPYSMQDLNQPFDGYSHRPLFLPPGSPVQCPPSPSMNQLWASRLYNQYNNCFNHQAESFIGAVYPQHPVPPGLSSMQPPRPSVNITYDYQFNGSITLDSVQYSENVLLPLYTSTNIPEITSQVRDAEKVCYGMVTNIEGFYKLKTAIGIQSTYSVSFQNSETFVGTLDNSFRGTINANSTHIISALLDEAELEIEASVLLQGESLRKAKSTGPQFSQTCVIQVVLYGPMDLFDQIGSFFEDHDIYIQDPVNCQRDVPYRNPHRLSNAPNTPNLTSELGLIKNSQAFAMKDVEALPDLLDVLNSQSQENLAEMEPPTSLKTSLKRHQKQALAFMLQREMGWAWDGSRPDIWEAVEIGHEKCFSNRISGSYQNEEPPQFYGGIIADPMGLGKTLSMISLIASDLEIDYRNPASLSGIDLETSSRRTLVIVPPPLLSTWEEQLKGHIHPNRLSWCLHHGKCRLTESKLESSLMVLTTYHTVSIDWKARDDSDLPILFKTKWKRLVLDEAHFIRNSDSQMARAICQIDSVSRWAVTGTPVQNKLGDLAALLIFLRAYPYSQKKVFESEISHFWKLGQDEEAVNRLRRLASCLILRRSKDILHLPARHDMIWPVEITFAERKLYNDVKMQAITNINEVLSRDQGINRTTSVSFVNVLQRIEAMRMVCNLGLRYHGRHTFSQLSKEGPRDAHLTRNWNVSAQEVFNIRRSMSQIQCQDCLHTVDALEAPIDTSEAKSLFSECFDFLCSNCARDKLPVALCSHTPPCPVAPVSLSLDTLNEPTVNSSTESSSTDTSSKIKLLIQDLLSLPTDTKSVVFSTWRMTLDIAEAGLRQASIRFLRFDGKVPQKDRQNVIDCFRNDPSIKVLLLTLSCGAVGITLTQASRAYLMEPHWNPTLEDQALARIHRIGQTNEVTTIRFIVKDSFEERIIELQKSKRDLASILLNARKSEDEKQADEPQRPLEWLRELLD